MSQVPWIWSSRVFPASGEQLSGDFVLAKTFGTNLHAVVVDVSGHGEAAYAIGQGLRDMLSIDDSWPSRPADVLRALHMRLRGTAGATAMSLLFEWRDGTHRLTYAGIGDVRIVVQGASPLTDEGRPGHLGLHFHRVQVGSLFLSTDDVVLVFSDGLRSDAKVPPSRLNATVDDMASEVMLGYSRKSDDASCLVVRPLRT